MGRGGEVEIGGRDSDFPVSSRLKGRGRPAARRQPEQPLPAAVRVELEGPKGDSGAAGPSVPAHGKE